MFQGWRATLQTLLCRVQFSGPLFFLFPFFVLGPLRLVGIPGWTSPWVRAETPQKIFRSMALVSKGVEDIFLP